MPRRLATLAADHTGMERIADSMRSGSSASMARAQRSGFSGRR
jgi:hypothetical protein